MTLGWNARQPITCSVVVVVLLAGAGCAPAREKPKPEASAGPLRLPSPLPDIVAMVRTEEPASGVRPGPRVKAVGAEAGPRQQRLKAVRLRQRQGDRKEARRLFQAFAGEHRKTPEAAEALFEVVQSLVGWYSEGRPTASDFEEAGKTALGLADENPGHYLAPRSLHLYVSEVLEAWGLTEEEARGAARPPKRIEPSAEEWMRVFRAASALAGRYPDDERGPACLLLIADALAGSPEAKPGAIGIYRLVSEWPGARDARVFAYKALHDDAVARGELGLAEAVARRAATTCAGKTFAFDAPRSKGAEPGTPWHGTMTRGVPSSGRILLPAPPWKEGERFFFRLRWEYYDCSQEKWLPAGRHPVRGMVEETETLLVDILNREPGGLCYAVSNRSLAARRPSPYSHSFRTPCLAFLGDPGRACPFWQSLLFVPEFPVREGAAMLPFEGIGLVRQEARAREGKVVVSLEAGGGTSWKQTWSEGRPWWDEATVEFETTHFPVDWFGDLWRYRAHARRIEKPEGRSFPPAKDLERDALREMDPWPPNEAATPLILARLAERFSGATFEMLKAKWKREPYRPAEPDRETEGLFQIKSLLVQEKAAEALKKLDERERWPRRHEAALELRAEALIALDRPREAAEILRWLPRRGPFASARALFLESRAQEACGERPRAGEEERARRRNPYDGFILRSLWRPMSGDRQPGDIRVDRTGGETSLLIGHCGDWRWRITPDGGELEVPAEPELPGSRPTDWHGTGRVEIGRRGRTTFVREADRIVALDERGKELWRHQVRAEVPKGTRGEAGLPFLAAPRLISSAEGDRIVCGVGQRIATFGMGIWYSPVGGGLLAVDLRGMLIYGKDLGFCEELEVIEGPDGTPVVVGLFLRLSETSPYTTWRERRLLACFHSSTGNLLWQVDLPGVKERGTFWQLKKRLYVGSRRIVASVGGARVFTVEGKERGAAEGVEVAMLADFDGDGKDEIVACKRDEGYATGGELSILDLGGRTLWRGPPGRWRACAAEDLDGDGWRELVAIREAPCRAAAVFGRFPGGRQRAPAPRRESGERPP